MLADAKEHFTRSVEMLSKVKEGLESEMSETSGFAALDALGAQIEGVEEQFDMIGERMEEIEELMKDDKMEM